jgi:rubredoxin-NAD+ reductase
LPFCNEKIERDGQDGMPRTELAIDNGLAVDRGVKVDRCLRASDTAIFALGDRAAPACGLPPFGRPLVAQARALAETLAGRPTPLAPPAPPLGVTTPCLPFAICAPPPGRAGIWSITGKGRDRKALFIAQNGAALGAALSGALTAQRQALAQFMPEVLANWDFIN